MVTSVTHRVRCGCLFIFVSTRHEHGTFYLGHWRNVLTESNHCDQCDRVSPKHSNLRMLLTTTHDWHTSPTTCFAHVP